ncbi:site-2 protease family protein [Ancylobacter terrae]|uniref:site-2 protease family protein n=1 Tax=Ancylobacter sp. sgz301288 TaxID=3342077 RepID=UPI00385FCFC2
MSGLLALVVSALKLGTPLATAGTMLVSVVLYGYAFGWGYGAGFVLMLLAHEMGHYIAARQCNVAVGAPIFIPFVGAWVALKGQSVDPESEAYIVTAGPFVGTLAAFAAYVASRETDSGLLMAVAYAGFILNLFNLLPVMPLDGGRLTAIISPALWWAGVPALAAVFLVVRNPLAILVAALALPYLIQSWRHRGQPPAIPATPAAPLVVRVEYGALYLILAGVLVAMTYSLHDLLRLSR